MSDSKSTVEAFRRFMKTVTGLRDHCAPVPDADDVRISELEREVRALRRNRRRKARRRRAALVNVPDQDT